jgi:hypothetical protein
MSWTEEQIAAWAGDANGAGPGRRYEFAAFADFATRDYPTPEPLLGGAKGIYLAKGTLFFPYGAEGASKSTWTIDGIFHLAAGQDWLGIPVPRPVRCLLIENEGPGGLFQRKLKAKKESWTGADVAENLHVFAAPWGEFSFADSGAREALTGYCDEHGIDLVAANPTLGLGAGASGKPDETQQFVDWMRECGLQTTRAFWPLHHENKSGQISGDWGRHADTLIHLEKDGHRQRTKLTWEKTRWITLDESQKAVMLEWETETEGYKVVPLDTVGASDEELVGRLEAYLKEHPATATKHVKSAVEGTDSRLAELLNSCPQFDFVTGKNNSKLWMLAGEGTE